LDDGDSAAQESVRSEAEVEELRARAEKLLASAQSARAEAEEESRARRTELREQRADLERREQRLSDREERLDTDIRALEEKSRQLEELKNELKNQRRMLENLEAEHQVTLERIAGLTAEQAKAELVAGVAHDAKRQAVLLARDIERQATREADARAQQITVGAIQRLASELTSESVVSAVHLPGDDMKGRIIGREGRNIRALEHLTGVDVIIDDTPQAVVLSSFDGIRREVAKLTLSKLIEDGRIHPARIEEMYYQSKAEIEDTIRQAGEQAVFEANCGEVHEELVKILGRLRFRTSYGQNVLKHTLEVVHLAGIMAAELEASVKTARRAALLHDLGKALTHEVDGSHALLSAQYARRYGESPAVVHAIEAHHYEVEPQTVEAVLLIAADAISASRPGARGESLEHYIKRLEALEGVAARHNGVEKVYALQAGREIRVIVKPKEIDDDAAVLLSHEIAREIEDQLEYPGQIKVTVIRESRAVEYAK